MHAGKLALWLCCSVLVFAGAALMTRLEFWTLLQFVTDRLFNPLCLPVITIVGGLGAGWKLMSWVWRGVEAADSAPAHEDAVDRLTTPHEKPARLTVSIPVRLIDERGNIKRVN